VEWIREGEVLSPGAPGQPDSLRAWRPWVLEEADGALRMWYSGDDGTQAEYVRVPFADTSTYLIPSGVSDESVLMLADIGPTGYEVGVLPARAAGSSRVSAEPATRSITVCDTSTSEGPATAPTPWADRDGDPAHVVAEDCDLSPVQPRSDLDPERSDCLRDRGCAPNRSGRPVEGRQAAK
jgi:hypothetical protein